MQICAARRLRLEGRFTRYLALGVLRFHMQSVAGLLAKILA